MTRIAEPREEANRVYYLLALIVASLLILLLRAWHLQVVHGAFYRDLSENNRLRTVPIPAERGLIFDRDGNLLVNSLPAFNLYVVPVDMGGGRGAGGGRDEGGSDEGGSDAARQRVLSRLARKLAIDPVEIGERIKKSSDPYSPLKIKEGLSITEVVRTEADRLDLPGVKIESEPRRNSVFGSFASHLVGYVAEVSPEDLAIYPGVEKGEMVGKFGIEKSYDAHLRGTTGFKSIEVDALGHERRVVKIAQPVHGRALRLTIDARVQKAAEEALGASAGAIVAIDPNSGELLAMASHPAFDPNLFSGGLSVQQWEALVEDPLDPLTNRAIAGQYPPGSTFKIVVSTAALETGTIDPGQEVFCRGSFPFGRRLFRDWKKRGHGPIGMHQAIVESCDVYFYQLGNRLGIDTIARFAALYGLGKETGIELASEKPGLVPSSGWKLASRHEPWFPGDTISVAIGQGYVTVTPLQLATMISAVATGRIPRPHAVMAVEDDQAGRMKERVVEAGKPLEVSAKTLAFLRESLRGAVYEPHGTGSAARSEIVTIGGKTGTAQVVSAGSPSGRRGGENADHAWFVAFAPVEEPRIAVTVLVEHGGHGGAIAAPLARKVIEAYLAAEASPPRVASAEAGESHAD